MSPEEIRLEFFKRRKTISQRKIAMNLKCSPTAIGLVIDKKMVSNRIMEAVADAIDRDKKYVFPEYFLKKIC